MKVFARSVLTATALSAVGAAVSIAILVRGIGRSIDATRWDFDDDEDSPEPMLFDPIEDFETHCKPLLDAFLEGAR